MTDQKVPKPDDAQEVAEITPLNDLKDTIGKWSPLNSAVPSSALPLLIISIVASVFGVFVLIALRAIDEITRNLDYIVFAIFAFYAVPVAQTLFESLWRRSASEREIEYVYALRKAIITKFLEKSESMGLEDVQALIGLANGTKIETEVKTRRRFGGWGG